MEFSGLKLKFGRSRQRSALEFGMGSGPTEWRCRILSRLLMVDFVFIFSIHFILFFFSFFFSFLFLEQHGLRFISHAVTSVTS